MVLSTAWVSVNEMIPVSLSLVFICIGLLIAWLYRSMAQSIPGMPGPRPYPIVGNVFEMFQCEAVDLLRSWTRRFGKILQYKVFLLGTQVLVTDVDAIHRVLVSNSRNYVKPETLLVPCRTMFGPRCLICLPPQEHDECRHIINPAFRTVSVRKMTSMFVRKTRYLVKTWTKAVTDKKLSQDDLPENQSDKDSTRVMIKVQDGITFLSLDILGVCAFGYEFASMEAPDSELARALHRILSIQTFNGLRFLPLYSRLPTQLNKDTALIKCLVRDVLKKKKSTMTDDDDGDASLKGNGDRQTDRAPKSHRDMLDILLQSRQECDGQMVAVMRRGAADSPADEGSDDKTTTPASRSTTKLASKLVLPDSDIVDDIHQFLIAGHETVTNTLCFALLQLAEHPDVQEKVRREAASVLPRPRDRKKPVKDDDDDDDKTCRSTDTDNSDADSTSNQRSDTDPQEGTEQEEGERFFEACQKMVYTECVLKETMRLFPAVPLTLRQSVGEDELGGYTIPPGTVIALHLATLMRQPDYFSDPDTFRPERFLPEDSAGQVGGLPKSDTFASLERQTCSPLPTSEPVPSETSVPSGSGKSRDAVKAFLPFLAGPEMCIGHRFAMVEMKVILGLLLLKFRVEPLPGRKFSGRQGLTYHVHPALELNLVAIDDNDCE